MKSSFKKLIVSNPYVLIDFYATWCGPCKMLSPTLEEVAKETKGKVKVIKIDIDKNQRVATDMNVRSVPTLILYKYGKQVWKQSGAPTKNDLMKLLNSHL